MNERVKFYKANDMCYGMHLDKITTCTIPELKEIDINDAIEFYQIKLYFQNGARSSEWSDEQYLEYSEKQKKLFSLTMRFFNALCNDNIIQEYNSVELDYKEVFWSLFDNCKLYNQISDSTFNSILYLKHVSPFHIFTKKDIVNKYGQILREYIKNNTFLAKLLVCVYEQDYAADGKTLYLPSELKNEEIYECLFNYIESNIADFSVLESIRNMKTTDRFQISDELRVKALNRYEEIRTEICETGIKIEHGIQLTFSKEQKEPKKIDKKGSETVVSYSTEWLLASLDYPSILNNFIYIFEYVDVLQMRCNLVSKKSQTSIVEDIFTNKKLSCYYPISTVFNSLNMLAQMQMAAYYNFLKAQNIRYEDVLKYFFTQYLQEEFDCSEIRVLFPSEHTTYYEKCVTLCSIFDSLLKQFSLYVKHKEIDPKLVSFSSNSTKIDNIPSLVKDKYIYGNGNLFDQITSILFSDQCPYSFVKRISEKKRHYNTFFELLKNEVVYLSDYREWDKPAFTLLAEKALIKISTEGKLSLGDKLKVHILKDLYDNEVISKYSYPLEADTVFEQWFDEGIIISKGGLFSEPEVNYLNYILNHVEFVNGLDLRNKYSHGVQSGLDDSVHQRDYYIFLIVLTILTIKINDDFILKEKIERQTKFPDSTQN